jgi:F-type H+-transporting ATPase subunit epsilon
VNKFKIEILSPQGIIFKDEVFSVSFPTLSGVITILSGHANLVTKLHVGEIIINSVSGVNRISVSGGFIEIAENIVNVIAEFAAHLESANRKKMEQAIKLAKDMKSKRREFANMSVIESELKKYVVELKSGLGIKKKM